MHYLANGLARDFGKGEALSVLNREFSVENKPSKLGEIVRGWSRIDAHGHLFESESALTDSGVFLNIIATGRAVIPWGCIDRTRQCTIAVDQSDQVSARLYIGKVRQECVTPWKAA